MRISWAVVVALVSMVLLAGCVPAEPESPTDRLIEIGSLYEPSNLSNVDAGGQGVTQAFHGNVYEGLFALNDDGSLTNLLAQEVEVSEDGVTYMVTLRPGVTFHSGKALTAADVKWSFERVVAEESQAARKSSFAVVEAVTTPDERTVVFHLSERSISLPYNLSSVWIVSPDLADPRADADGTGPYRFDSWRRGSMLNLTRNDDYWGEPAKNAGVSFHYFTDAAAQDNALISGRIDLITALQSPDALALFEDNPDFQVSEGTSTTKQLLAFNDQVDPFTDPRVRRALYSAIDREKLLDAVWAGRGQLIGSMVPPTDPWFEDLRWLNPYDPELSGQLLAEAGLGEGFTFTLATPNYDPHPAVAEFVASELAMIGVEVEIETITADQWYSKVFQERDYEATLQEHVNDRDVVWYANPSFYWQYDNPEVTELVARSERAMTETEQAEILREANRIIAGEAASLWLFLYPQIVVARSEISGFPVNGLNSQFFVADITKS